MLKQLGQKCDYSEKKTVRTGKKDYLKVLKKHKCF